MNEGSANPVAHAPGAFARLRRHRLAVVAMAILGFIALTAILAPMLFERPAAPGTPAPNAWHYDPETVSSFSKHPPTWLPVSEEQKQMDLADSNSANPVPGPWRYPFGTDLNGRDLLSRVIQGARISLLVGLCGALVSFFVGTAYGLISGYVGGRTDNVMMRLVEGLHSIPRLIIVIVAIFTFAPKLENWLNAGTLFSVFADNPRLVYTAIVLILFTVWLAAVKSTGVARGRLLLLLAAPCGWFLSGVLTEEWLLRCYAAFLCAGVFLFLFMKVAGHAGTLRTVAGVLVATALALVLSPLAEGQLSGYSLHPLVGYNKVVILILCLGLIEWLSMARIVRGQVLALKEQQFVLAARSLGQSHARILLRHLLPNLVGVVVVYLTLTIPAVILDESFLSFLGLGINDPQASWGSLLSDGKNVINPIHSYWWLLIFPAAAMSLTLLALNFLGDALRDALDPRAKR